MVTIEDQTDYDLIAEQRGSAAIDNISSLISDTASAKIDALKTNLENAIVAVIEDLSNKIDALKTNLENAIVTVALRILFS